MLRPCRRTGESCRFNDSSKESLRKVGRLPPYLALGVVLWFFVHQSGIHSTIAGVLLALMIPTRTRINAAEFSAEARSLLDEFDRTETGDLLVLTSRGQQDALFSLGDASKGVTAPLLRLEHALHLLSAFVIMPVFAFANAGISIGASALDWRLVLGILLGLAVGKPLGIMAAAWASPCRCSSPRWPLEALPCSIPRRSAFSPGQSSLALSAPWSYAGVLSAQLRRSAGNASARADGADGSGSVSKLVCGGVARRRSGSRSNAVVREVRGAPKRPRRSAASTCGLLTRVIDGVSLLL